MAERYQFQYYPVTGKLTGNQMIEQTEQAINELAQNVYEGSAQVEVINTIVNQAEQNAEQALEKATQALESTGRVYLDELTAVNLNNYYNSELLYIGDETSENLPVADTGFLEVKTNDSMTNAAQVFIADSSGLLYFRQATIIPQEVGSVTTYDVTWGTWFTYATQEYIGDNYLSLAGGTMTGGIVSNVSVNTPAISMSTDNNVCFIFGGSDVNKGARIGLNGKDSPSYGGCFTISADNGTNTKQLQGRPDGTLTWDEKTVIVGTEATETFSNVSVGANASVNVGTLAHVPKYYSILVSGAGFADCSFIVSASGSVWCRNLTSVARTLGITVNYIY